MDADKTNGIEKVSVQPPRQTRAEKLLDAKVDVQIEKVNIAYCSTHFAFTKKPFVSV